MQALRGLACAALRDGADGLPSCVERGRGGGASGNFVINPVWLPFPTEHFALIGQPGSVAALRRGKLLHGAQPNSHRFTTSLAIVLSAP